MFTIDPKILDVSNDKKIIILILIFNLQLKFDKHA